MYKITISRNYVYYKINMVLAWIYFNSRGTSLERYVSLHYSCVAIALYLDLQTKRKKKRKKRKEKKKRKKM